MDYTRAPLMFRLRKVLRYVRLYGPRRTVVKVRGQLHMAGRPLPVTVWPKRAGVEAHVGVIGCGNFAYTTIAHYLDRRVGQVIRGAMDLDAARAASLGRDFGARYSTTDASRILQDPAIDVVYIASNHASHAEYAIAALEAGKHVHIEKPHVVDEDQLRRLCSAMSASAGSVRLGFNRPDSRLGREVRGLVDEQQGPMMVNWFVAGHEIAPDHWYFREAEGGRVLGNLCHWTDFCLRLVSQEHRFPVQIRPARAEKSDADIAVSYVFADGSIAAITFSAKGHTFEGVRERLNLHRGDLLLAMADFKELVADIREKRRRTSLPFRDHGHADAVLRAYDLSGRRGHYGEGLSVREVWETGILFLRTREALEADQPLVVEGFDASVLTSRGDGPRA